MKSLPSMLLGCMILMSSGCTPHAINVERQELAQDMATHRQLITQMERGQRWLAGREQAQQRMLHALSPAHSALLARLVGELATSNDPQVVAAANELDAKLSAQEKKEVLAADNQLHEQWQADQWQRVAHWHSADPGMVLLLTVVSVTSQRTSQAAHALVSPHKVHI